MEQSLNKSTGYFILGAAAGAVFMAFMTPHTGNELREKITESMRKAKSKAGKVKDNIDDEATQLDKSIRQKISDSGEA